MVHTNPQRIAFEKFDHASTSYAILRSRKERIEQARVTFTRPACGRNDDHATVSKAVLPQVVHRYDTGAVHPEAPLVESDPWLCHEAYFPVHRSLREAGIPLPYAKLKVPFHKVNPLLMLARKLNYVVSRTLRDLLPLQRN